MSDRIRIDQLASEVMAGLTEYADLATDDMKKVVKKAGATVRKEIQTNAPKNTGDYAESWSVKKMNETAILVSHNICQNIKRLKKYYVEPLRA